MSDPSKENAYDRILKENLVATFSPILETLFSLKVKQISSLPGTDKQQYTIEREPDFIKKIQTNEGKEWILHLEFQTTNDYLMVERMLIMYGLIYIGNRLPLKQYVIYLGNKPMRMKNQFEQENIHFQYNLYNIKETTYDQWLVYDIPEAILLAVLANFKKENPSKIIRAILHKLKKLVPDTTRLNKYISQLKILSRLPRLDQTFIKELEDMAISYNIKEDYLYQLGIKEGEKVGEARGEAKGKEIGKKKEKIIVVKKALLSQIFLSGKMGYKDIAELSELSIEEIRQIHQQMQSGQA